MIGSFSLDKSGEQPLYIQLYHQIRGAIERGEYQGATKLSSIRALSKQLEISRTTIENAYNQLIMEGYIVGKPGSGYYVEEIGGTFLKGEGKHYKEKSKVTKDENQSAAEKAMYYDESLFNMKTWRKSYNKALTESEQDLYKKLDSQGIYKLREKIAEYVFTYRGVEARPEQIVIGAGVQSLLQMLCHLLKDQQYEKIAVESPGFIEPHHIFKNYGIAMEHIPVLKDGMNIEGLSQTNCDLCYVSPSHQFPVGGIMPISKRLELIKWAKDRGAYIIEDDYDGELIYSGQPVPALQGLDRQGNVIYLGSLSTLFVPTLRISYMIVPETLLESFKAIKSLYNSTVAGSEQYALATFMEDGELEKHIRRLKNILSKKNKRLKESIKKHLTGSVTITSGECGTYMVLKFLKKIEVNKVSKWCKSKGIAIEPITHFSLVDRDYGQIGVLMYRDVPLDRIEEVVCTIKEVVLRQ